MWIVGAIILSMILGRLAGLFLGVEYGSLVALVVGSVLGVIGANKQLDK